MDKELFRKMKVIFIAYYNFEMNSEGFDKAEKYLKQIEDMVETDRDWKDGGHMGDCTKQSTTCFRCWLEDFDRLANESIKYLKGII